MKFTFLGTGTSQGIPVIGCECEVCQSQNLKDKRLRSSAHLEWDDIHINIDVGPDFRAQMLNNGIPDIDAILLTHEHNDHVIGLDDIRPYNFKRKKSIEIFGQQRVLDELKIRFGYVFSANKYPGAPSVNAIPITENLSILIGDKEIIPIQVMHGNLPILGYRFGDLAYLTDVKHIVDSEFEKLKNLDVLVINALQDTEHHAHLTLEESLLLIKRISPKRAYLTHLSHRLMGHNDLQKSLPENVFVGFDGLIIESK